MQPYQHFTLEERESLQEMLSEGKSLRAIALALGRNVSSVSREIKRNRNKNGSYHPWRATTLYIVRRKKCRRKPRLADQEVNKFVKEALDQYWSPEIVSQRWRKERPEAPLSHSTIYRALKQGLLPGYTRKTHLRRRGKQKHNHTTQVIYPVHTIHDRPEIVDARGRLGDMEGDTVSGAIGKGCVVTAIDRKSRMLYAAISQSRNSSQVAQAFARAFDGIKVNSLTLDRGSEFAKFVEIEQNLQTTVFFADPHAPWQRPSNENINGLLRFSYPKGTDFTSVQNEDFQHILALINNRPRKCLGWLSPLEFISSKYCT
jgi:IS30 family transposase